jgi:hypothetical protein
MQNARSREQAFCIQRKSSCQSVSDADVVFAAREIGILVLAVLVVAALDADLIAAEGQRGIAAFVVAVALDALSAVTERLRRIAAVVVRQARHALPVRSAQRLGRAAVLVRSALYATAAIHVADRSAFVRAVVVDVAREATLVVFAGFARAAVAVQDAFFAATAVEITHRVRRGTVRRRRALRATELDRITDRCVSVAIVVRETVDAAARIDVAGRRVVGTVAVRGARDLTAARAREAGVSGAAVRGGAALHA